MKQTIKNSHWGLTIFMVLFISVASFAQSEPTPEPELGIISQPEAISIVPKDQSATLSFVAEQGESKVEYQWYQSTDGTVENSAAITNAIESSYTTDIFADKEIRYYYCVATVGEENVVSDMAVVANTGLPVLYVNTPDGVEITSKEVWTENATLTLTGAEDNKWNFENISTSIRGRGNTTWGQKKKPYALKLDKKQEIMGMPKHKRWVLIANYLDNSFLKNHMAFYLSDIFEMDYTVHGKFVNLVFNGTYRGLYWLGEAITVDENRIKIDDGNKKMADNEDKDYLIEMDVNYDEPVKFKSSIRNLPYMIKNDDYMVDDDGNLTNGGEARLERLKTKINKLEKLLYPDFVEGMNINACIAPNEIYTKTLDVDSWAKFWFLNSLMDNGELGWPKSAYFTYESKEGIFKAGPVWDFDWAALNKSSSVHLNDIYFNALFKSQLFKVAVKRLWSEYSSNIDIESEIESMREYLKVAAEVDRENWGVHLDPKEESGKGDFNDYVDFLKEVLLKRVNVINNYVINSVPELTVVAPTIALSSGTYEYNGAEIKPGVTIMDDENSLTDDDYTITYLDNINAGTATVFFAAKGNYAGIQEKSFTISPKPVTLTVTNTSKTYGADDPALDYTVDDMVSVEGVTEKLSSVELVRESGEDAGEYAITATVDASSNPNYTITTKDGKFTIEPDATEIVVSVNGRSHSVEYNGKIQSVQGFDMSTDNKAYSLNFVSYTGDSLVSGIDAKTYAMGLSVEDFKNTSVNYSNVVFNITDGQLVIAPKSAALTVTNASKTYGEKDPALNYTVEGLVSIDGIEDKLKDVTLSRTAGENVGDYAISASIVAESNPNYIVTTSDGKLTVNPNDTKITVTVKGHVDTLEYNGQKQSVQGFDLKSSNEAYSLEYVAYSGDSLVSGTDAKTYSMGLVAKDFKNTSKNYSNVIFDVVDGSLVVNPKPVTLTVVNASKIYGDQDPVLNYTVEGLAVINEIEDKLKDVTLSRTAGENVGKYAVKAVVAVESNPNYIVKAKDGLLTINPNDTRIVISVTGHSDTVEYNGKKHVVNGFEMTSNNEKYSLEYVCYTGNSVVSGTKAKTYSMGLSADDFKNTSANYSNVVFEVIDGNLVIKQQSKKDAVLASRSNVGHLKAYAIGRNIHIDNSVVGERFAVVDLQGIVVQTGIVESASFNIPISKSGIYIVRMGSKLQRVRIQ